MGLGGTDQFRATFTDTTHTMSLPEELHCDNDNHDTEMDANNNSNRIQNIRLRDKIYESLMVGTEVWYLTNSTGDGVSFDELPQLIDISDSETDSDDSDWDSDSSKDDSEEMSMSSETESAEDEVTSLPGDFTMDQRVPPSKMEERKKHIQVSDLFASQRKLNT